MYQTHMALPIVIIFGHSLYRMIVVVCCFPVDCSFQQAKQLLATHYDECGVHAAKIHKRKAQLVVLTFILFQLIIP